VWTVGAGAIDVLVAPEDGAALGVAEAVSAEAGTCAVGSGEMDGSVARDVGAALGAALAAGSAPGPAAETLGAV
jgi:hypothetical protein